MTLNTSNTVLKILALGMGLAFIKLGYLFFDFYNILDFILFLFAGFGIGRKLSSKRFSFGLLISFPAFLLCLSIVINLGYSSIINGVGTAYAVSLFVMPVATCIGIAISSLSGLEREKKR